MKPATEFNFPCGQPITSSYLSHLRACTDSNCQAKRQEWETQKRLAAEPIKAILTKRKLAKC